MHSKYYKSIIKESIIKESFQIVGNCVYFIEELNSINIQFGTPSGPGTSEVLSFRSLYKTDFSSI